MTTTATVPRLMTDEDLLLMPRGYGKRYELVRGELVARMLAGHSQASAVTWIAYALTQYEIDTGYGQVKSGSPGYRLESNPDTVRAPAVAWVAPGRIPPGTQGYPNLAPDLVVEVLSPGQDLADKARMWLSYGTREVWVAQPVAPVSVTRYRPGQLPVTLYDDDVLDGGDLLPGFSIPVWRLFRRQR